MRKIIALIIALLSLFSGCSKTRNNPPPDQEKPHAPETIVSEAPLDIITSEPETSTCTEEPSQEKTATNKTESTSESPSTVSSQPSQEPPKVTPKAPEPKSNSDEKKAESKAEPETTTQVPAAEPITKPEPQPPKETPITDVPKTEPVTDPVTTVDPEPKPEFSISYWINFAKGYAQKVGLVLNSEAVDCWDNPTYADASCIYLERDLSGRLNRYAKDPDVTDVWIWYESIGNGEYLIYIGYA